MVYGAIGQPNASREYNIKAAFIYNFTQFIEWPEDSFENAASPFVIGILGKDPFGPAINETVEGEKVQGHPIIIQRYSSLQEIKECHILFVSNTESGNIKEIIAGLRNKNILTVSDIPGFPVEGGMIGFMMENNKTKLQINPSIAKAADINISSKLLRLAEIVGQKK
jgi:hypothetical protein